jgi:hypothetical protein
MEYGGTAPCILMLGTRWCWMVSFTPWVLYSWGKQPCYHYVVGGMGSRVGLVAVVTRKIFPIVQPVVWWLWGDIPVPILTKAVKNLFGGGGGTNCEMVFCVDSAQYISKVIYDCFFHPLIFCTCTSRLAILLNLICLLNGLHSLLLLHTEFIFDQFSVAWSLGNVTHYHKLFGSWYDSVQGACNCVLALHYFI